MKGNELSGSARKRLVAPADKKAPGKDKRAALGALPREAAQKVVAPDAQRAGLSAALPDGDLQRWVQAAINLVLGTKLPLDGRMTPVVREALRRFQRQEGLQTHGAADEKTLQVLELRTGAQRPRGAGHEDVRSLLILPNRVLWMPKPGSPSGDKGKDGREAGEAADSAAVVSGGSKKTKVGEAFGVKPKGSNAAGGPKVDDEVVDAELATVQPGVRSDAVSPSDAFGQRESWRAVMSLMQSGPFVQRAAESLGKSDVEAVRKDMQIWVETLVMRTGSDAPAWLRTARADAKMDGAGAASLLRQAWWVEHVGAADGL